MQSLRDCYLGNLSGGEAQSETAGYRDEGEVRQTHSKTLEKKREHMNWHVDLEAQMKVNSSSNMVITQKLSLYKTQNAAKFI